MIKVVGVKFRPGGKTYFFDPAEMDIEQGDDLIVETARGIEFGHAVFGVRLVDNSEVVQPLKPVIRKATDEDRREHEQIQKKHDSALKLCEEKIAARGLDMKLVDVEYTFDNSKVIFYFTSDGRVDFRELVKDLASAFRMRIELRQIGVRDETKMMGGIGPCGRELCCHSFLDDFETVSIKMAKTQNLSLNPTKISGMCGRLMCCLQYENDTYLELRKGMPQPGDYIDTPDGKAVVDDVSILQNRIRARLVLDEGGPDKPEKLSSEYYVYKKEEISRDIKKKQVKRPESVKARYMEADAPLKDLEALED